MRILLAILFLLPLCFFAQQSVVETIAQCKEDLKVDAPLETRRSAVLVLGKYDTPEVTAILGRCLSDDDVEIRRSALAALAEDPLRLRAQAPVVLNCLLDDDVHIRRYASSLIPDCLGIVIRGAVRLGPGSRIITSASKGIPNASELLVHGLQDADPEVRRNVLQGAQYFDVSLPQEVVLPLLKDPSDEVVSMAISLSVNAVGDSTVFLENYKALLRHPNPQIRLTLASALAGRADALGILQKLSHDEVPKVRHQALQSRARIFSLEDEGLVDEIASALADSALVSEDGERLLSVLADVDSERAWQFIHGVLSGDGNSAMQESAWLQVVRHREWQESLELPLIVDALCQYSDNSRIRAMLLALLRKRTSELTSAEILRLQSSPLPSCRKIVFDLLRNLPAELQSEALMEALLDDDSALRLQAVNQFSSIRPQGWEAILIATLEDTDSALQHAAARGLLRGVTRNPEVKKALQDWLPQCTDASLRGQIEARFH